MNYIKRDINGTSIAENNEVMVNERSIKYFVNKLCQKNLSTYDGRRTSVCKIFGFKTLTPIYVNKEIFLFPTDSLRVYNMHFINYFEMLSITKKDYNTEIVFKDLTSLKINSSYYKISKQINRIKIILEYIENGHCF